MEQTEFGVSVVQENVVQMPTNKNGHPLKHRRSKLTLEKQLFSKKYTDSRDEDFDWRPRQSR